MFSIEDHGTIVLIRPLTPDAKAWLLEHVDPEAQWFGDALAAEPRYAEVIAETFVEDGFDWLRAR